MIGRGCAGIVANQTRAAIARRTPSRRSMYSTCCARGFAAKLLSNAAPVAFGFADATPAASNSARAGATAKSNMAATGKRRDRILSSPIN
jgi:hypothetical protein